MKEKYISEDELQAAVAQKPKYLEVGNEGIELVKREFDIGIKMDLLCVTDSGVPVIVEAKLFGNSEIRRKVIGQGLDYIASLCLMTRDEVDVVSKRGLDEALTRIAKRTGGNKRELELEFSSNLKKGNVILAFVIDEENVELTKIAQFLEQHTDFEIRLIKLTKFRDEEDGKVRYIHEHLVVSKETAKAKKTNVIELRANHTMKVTKNRPEESDHQLVTSLNNYIREKTTCGIEGGIDSKGFLWNTAHPTADSDEIWINFWMTKKQCGFTTEIRKTPKTTKTFLSAVNALESKSLNQNFHDVNKNTKRIRLISKFERGSSKKNDLISCFNEHYQFILNNNKDNLTTYQETWAYDVWKQTKDDTFIPFSWLFTWNTTIVFYHPNWLISEKSYELFSDCRFEITEEENERTIAFTIVGDEALREFHGKLEECEGLLKIKNHSYDYRFDSYLQEEPPYKQLTIRIEANDSVERAVQVCKEFIQVVYPIINSRFEEIATEREKK